jgi:hypothetical protein
MKSIFTLLLAVLIPASTCLAQDPVPLNDLPGTWSYGYLNDENTKMYIGQFGMTMDEVVTFRQKLDRIVMALKQNRVMIRPMGIDPMVESRPLFISGFRDHPQYFGYIGEINFRLCPWFNSKGKIYKVTIEPPRVSMYVNEIVKLRRSAFTLAGPEDPAMKKAEDQVRDICRPDKIKELAPGVTLYDAAIVAGKPGRSLYLPCSVEEAYRRLITFYEIAAKLEPMYLILLDNTRKDFARVSPAVLKNPAYFGGEWGITSQANKDPLYLFNNDYFDRNKPKTDVQLLVIPIDAEYFRKESDFEPNSFGFLRIHQFLNSLDPAILAGLID